jgi:hypothetical protein
MPNFHWPDGAVNGGVIVTTPQKPRLALCASCDVQKVNVPILDCRKHELFHYAFRRAGGNFRAWRRAE